MPLPWSSRLASRFGDLVHLPAYFAFTYLGIAVSDRFVSDKLFTRLLTTLGIISVSGCIELLQAKLGRSASFADLLTNASGAAIGLLVHLSSGCDSITKRSVRIFAILSFLFVASGPVRSLLDALRLQQFPYELGSFATSAELERWYVSSAAVDVIADNTSTKDGRPGNAMEVRFQPGEFPAVQLQHLTSDWTGLESLAFELSRPAKDTAGPLVIQIRIRDNHLEYNPRRGFTESYELAPGERKRIAIPIGWIGSGPNRWINVSHIRSVEFIALELKQPATIRLANLRLCPNSE